MNTNPSHWIEFLTSQSLHLVVLFVVIGLLTLLVRKQSAHLRYLLWLVMLVKCLVPPLWTIPMAILPQQAEPAVVTPQPLAMSEVPQDFSVATSPLSVPTASVPMPEVDVNPPVTQEVVAESVLPSSSTTWFERIDREQGVLVFWLAGVLVFLLITLYRVLRFGRWIRRMRQPLNQSLLGDIESLGSGFDPPLRVQVYTLDGISQPFVWGLWRGSIYVPANFEQTGSARLCRETPTSARERDIFSSGKDGEAGDIERIVDTAGRSQTEKGPLEARSSFLTQPNKRTSVLLHEMAHVRRMDPLVNLIQILVQAVYWFHPLVWITNRFIRAEREKCCDEIAIAKLNTTPKDYGSAIVETLVQEYQARHAVPTLAVAGPVKNLEDRIKTIMKPGKRFYTRPSFKALLVTLLLAVVAVPTTVALTQRAGSTVVTSEASDKDFTATLSNGVTVELVGLGTAPWEESQEWWRPNGEKMETPEIKHHLTPWNLNADPNRLQFVCAPLLELTNVEDEKVTIPRVEFQDGILSLMCGARFGVHESKHLSYIVANPHMSAPDSADIRFAISMESYRQAKAVSKVPVPTQEHEYYVLDDGLFVIVHPFRIGPVGTLTVDVTIPENVNNIEFKVKARLKNGDVENWAGGSIGDEVRFYQSTPKRQNTRIEDIEELLVEYRPYEWITFEQVSLEPGKVPRISDEDRQELERLVHIAYRFSILHDYQEIDRIIDFENERQKERFIAIREELDEEDYGVPGDLQEWPIHIVGIDVVGENQAVVLALYPVAQGYTTVQNVWTKTDHGWRAEVDINQMLREIETYRELSADESNRVMCEQGLEEWYSLQGSELERRYEESVNQCQRRLRMIQFAKRNNLKGTGHMDEAECQQSLDDFKAKTPEEYRAEKIAYFRRLLGPEEQFGKLEFRIAPASVESSRIKSILSAEEEGQYREVLLQRGPYFVIDGQNDYIWLPVCPGVDLPDSDLMIQPYEGRKYVLVSNRVEQMMVPDGTWGLTSVYQNEDAMGRPSIGLELNEAGGEKMSEISSSHLMQYMAIIVDGEVLSTPHINSVVARHLGIVGGFTEDKVRKMVIVLQKGKGFWGSHESQTRAIDDQADQDARVRLSGRILNKLTGQGIAGATFHFVGAPDDNAITYPDGSFSTVGDRARFHQILLWLEDEGERLRGKPMLRIDLNPHIDPNLAQNLQIHIDPESLMNKPILRDEDGDGVLCDTVHCAICNPDTLSSPQPNTNMIQPVDANSRQIKIDTRLMLVPDEEATWQALERAGLPLSRIATSVMRGSIDSEEVQRNLTLGFDTMDANALSEVNALQPTVSEPLDDELLKALMVFSQNNSESCVISAPAVTVLDRESAQISMGSGLQFDPPATSEPVFIGVKIDVRPHLSPRGHDVYLEINANISNIIGFEEKEGNPRPLIEVSEMQVGASVPLGRTYLALGPSVTADSIPMAQIESEKPARLLLLIRPEIID